MVKKLDANEISEKLKAWPDWQYLDDEVAIKRTFKFKNFNQAFSFMTRCALKAKKLNHHPEWLNIYNRVEVTLRTHDVSGVSDLDFQLAKFMDEIASA